MGYSAIHPTPKTSLDSTIPLPLNVDEITQQWLENALGVRLERAHIVQVMPGTATKIFVDITYHPAEPIAAQTGAGPRRVCIKGGFDPLLRELGMNSAYRREAEFFAHIAPALQKRNVRLPGSLYCGTDVVEGQGIVILEDLIAANCTFGQCLEPWLAPRAAVALEQLAGLHAMTWGARPVEYPWLSEVPIIEEVLKSMFSPEYWDSQFYTENCPLGVPDHMLDRERMYDAFKTLWRTENPDLTCIVHGDCHVGNTFLSPPPAQLPGFLDFQAPQIGSAMHDVAYFLGGALTVEDRRTHERELLKHYLDKLHEAGGPRLGVEDVWMDYRKHHLHGFVWVLTGPRMQAKTKVDAMTERHVAAILDHESIELLEGIAGKA
ncbi:hypothetical protein K432DRAFT_350766 [Lepidopterella palustris CBS 459.81]|uniref:CHK kinase-like domain-containing protein n=1 Tax=Lepidopterella palustris CBS 459.81 TaxID=1314670 RepID=A0A8E2JGA6_9PEZI|nr:hypothetical protein K432DRAFT_350766 [Lepidopterella palustris CBS 459.81]